MYEYTEAVAGGKGVNEEIHEFAVVGIDRKGTST
jgi:hypothetical protein